MDSLLAELSTQEEIQIHYTKSKYQQHSYRNKNNNKPKPKGKQCLVCKSVGRPHTGHDVGDGWFISKFEKMEIAKALQVTVDPDNQDISEQQLIANNIQKLDTDSSNSP